MPGVEMGSSEQQRAAESPSPSAFAALNGKGTAPPAAKKPKLTFAEQEFKRVQKAIADRSCCHLYPRGRRTSLCHAPFAELVTARMHAVA
jgi:hypothetical protein